MPHQRTSDTSERPETGAPPRVFVSYSHDSAQHKAQVLELAQRLCEDGVDCHIDAFEEAPPEGWPAWMGAQIRDADYVVVICTAVYYRRITGREREGVGLGARWEGGHITQALYESGGRNEKFVPVVFSADDIRHIPEFLRATTYYEASSEAGYTALYRRLTRQPAVQRRPLGPIRKMPPVDESSRLPVTTKTDAASPTKRRTTRALVRPSGQDSAELVLVDVEGTQLRFIPATSIESAQSITVDLVPDAGADRVLLEELGSRGGQTIGVAFGLAAFRGRVSSITRTRTRGAESFRLVVSPEPNGGAGFTEMGTTGYSADDIAMLRARRILLDETISTRAGGLPGPRYEDTMLDTLVRGLNTNRPVARSPLPSLYGQLEGTERSHFLRAACLTAVYWLWLSGTVEHVLELRLRLKGREALGVRFHGRRRRVYSNQEPVELRVEGDCPLSPAR